MEWWMIIVLVWLLLGLVVGRFAYAVAKRVYNTGEAADDESAFWLLLSVPLWPLTLFALFRQQAKREAKASRKS